MARTRPHGRFLAGEAGELAGVSGTTIGQWARRGYIRASRSAGDPHVYSLEDVVEASVVHALLESGVGHAAIRRTIAALGEYGEWPLTVAPLATTTGNGGPRIVLAERAGVFALSGRGWQRLAVEPPLRRLHPALPGLPATAADAPDGD
jgi:DNA-binding transcriptional MerR regulator